MRDQHDLECPKCGASKAFSIYHSDDGHGYCHKCRHYEPPEGAERLPQTPKPRKRTAVMLNGVVTAIADRKITKATCEKYGVTVETGRSGEVTHHNYPHYSTETGNLVAAKRKDCEAKRDGLDRPFTWTGDRGEIGLFGQNTCRGAGKYITVCEGELDCLSVSQMFENKFDVVSLTDGAGGQAVSDIKRSLEFLEGYDNIVLCFDMDKAGRETTDSVKDLFSPSKVKIVSLPQKDANEMLVAGQSRGFIKAWWDAKTYQPDGIVSVKDTWAGILTFRDTPSVPYPWPGLNDLLLGQRKQEIVTWGAPTGVGKTTFMREVEDNLLQHIPAHEKVGVLKLEESVAKSVLGWMSFKAGRPLHKELNAIPEDELRRYWEEATEGDRYVLLDHQGWRNSVDTLKARIRYMRHALDCHWIVLDHLHIVLSSIAGASGDWSGIDELMTELRSMVHELDIGMHLVSHTSGELSFRGSKGIGQLSDAAIFLDRDKHAEGEVANITKVVVDKNRFAGDVGTACYLKYDPSTGRLRECEDPGAPPPPEEF